jgi:hypothetical protein
MKLIDIWQYLDGFSVNQDGIRGGGEMAMDLLIDTAWFHSIDPALWCFNSLL